MPKLTRGEKLAKAAAAKPQDAGTSNGAQAMPESEGTRSFAPMPKTRQRKVAPQLEPLDIDGDLLDNPERMNFVLLLAMLAKSDGKAEFSKAELDIEEGDFNIMFAKSIDGKKVIVSIVSVQSGILKAPAARKENAAWQEETPDYQKARRLLPPDPTEPGGAGLLKMPSTADMMGVTAEATPQEMFLQQAQAEQKAKLSGTTLPFQIGSSPQTAGPVDLGAYSRSEQKSQQIAMEEAEIAARVEQEGH